MVKALDVSDIKEISTSAIPAGIECGGGDSPGSVEHVTSIEVRLVKEKETTSSVKYLFNRTLHLHVGENDIPNSKDYKTKRL